MSAQECARRDLRRVAYAEYIALFWRLHRLPPGHPERPALAAALAHAEARWRGAARVPSQAVPAPSGGSSTISNQ